MRVDDDTSFGDLYLATRGRLLLQCLALTGDLGASRDAVRDAFVAARHHWRKVARLEDPEEWIRTRAWSIAQRRSAAHLLHREKGLEPEQEAVLAALASLPDQQRKTLLLTHLATLSMPEIGRELGTTLAATEDNLQHATTAFALALDTDSATVRARLETLAPIVASPGLPRVTTIRRAGVRRRRWFTVGSAIIALALLVAAGWFVTGRGGNGTVLTAGEKQAHQHPVRPAMLLRPTQLTPIAHSASWTVTETGTNTTGTGIHTLCQQSRFADDRGVGAWVRTLHGDGTPARDLVEAVEVSASPGAAIATYDTTLGWYAGCSHAGVQLVQAYKVTGLGGQAAALRLSIPGSRPGSYLVVVTRSSELTLSTVLRTDGRRADDIRALTTVASSALHDVCRASAAGHCGSSVPTVAKTLPPLSGETRGMLAAVDLPPVARIDLPWVGTDPVHGGPNLAATTCDEADFARAGSPMSRTYLIPQAHLPTRFGITETQGRFASVKAARAFLDTVRHKMATCPKRQLGSHVTHAFRQAHGPQRSTYDGWRLTTEINAHKQTVSYWMGVAQVGRYVAQVGFAPTGKDDLGRAAFEALVARARDRLFELG